MKSIPNFWIFFKSSFINQRLEVKNNRCSSSYSLSNWYSGILKSCSKSTSTSCFFLPRLPRCLYQNMNIQRSSWSYRKISLVPYQFSSVLHQFSWSLLLTETLLVSFILFRFVFGTKGGILKSLIISLIFFCRISLLEKLNTLLNPYQKTPKFWLIFQGQPIGGMYWYRGFIRIDPFF